MRARRTTRVIGMCCVGVLALAACGSSSKSSGSTPRIHASGAAPVNDHHESPAQVCALVPQSDVSKLLGRPATRNNASSLSAATGACIWDASDAKVRSSLQARIYDSTAAFKPTLVPGAATVPGVGSRAYAYALGSLGYELVFEKGSKVAMLQLTVAPAPGAAPPPSAAERAAALIALARTMAARM